MTQIVRQTLYFTATVTGREQSNVWFCPKLGVDGNKIHGSPKAYLESWAKFNHARILSARLVHEIQSTVTENLEV